MNYSQLPYYSINEYSNNVYDQHPSQSMSYNTVYCSDQLSSYRSSTNRNSDQVSVTTHNTIVQSVSPDSTTTTSGSKSRKPKSRINTSLKERKRNMAINSAFSMLQNLILPDNMREQRLSKIKTLRLATKKIEDLRYRLLSADQQPVIENDCSSSDSSESFREVVLSELQARNSYKARANEELQRGHNGIHYEHIQMQPYYNNDAFYHKNEYNSNKY